VNARQRAAYGAGSEGRRSRFADLVVGQLHHAAERIDADEHDAGRTVAEPISDLREL
jgi:hypothetical protein